MWNEARHAVINKLHFLILIPLMKYQWAKDLYKHTHFYTTLPRFSYAAFHDFPCHLPEASPLANTHSFGKDPHEFRELMCQEGQHGCEGTQSSSKENKEGKLLFGVNWDFMESCGEEQKGVLELQWNARSGNFSRWDRPFRALTEAFWKGKM